MIGWAAARGRLDAGAFILFAILFLWQIPHFLAIAWLYRDDYARAGFPMLPVLDREGTFAGRQAVVHSLALLLVSLAPVVAGLAGPTYLAGAFLLGVASDPVRPPPGAGARPRRRPGAVPGVARLPAGALVPAAGGTAVTFQDLPTLNAVLNTASAVLVLAGWWLIRHGRRDAHRRAMLLAVATSTLFLVSYLVYHFEVGSVRFTGQGPIRTVYFVILVGHTVLAVAIVPLVLVDAQARAARPLRRAPRLARITLPLWLWVSVSGVVVYWMLYKLEPR